jgi:WD40 repeat protein
LVDLSDLIEENTEALPHPYNGAISGRSFSADSKTVASASQDDSIKIWSTEILSEKELLERGCSLIRDYLRTNPNVEDIDRQTYDIARGL